MGSMDRNTVIGFVLLAALLFVYLYISTQNSKELQYQQQKEKDSIAFVQRAKDAMAARKDTAAVSQLAVDTSGVLKTTGKEELTVIENEVIKITFSNKGGQPRSVQLKKYTSLRDSSPVVLNSTSFDRISYQVNAGTNKTSQVAEMYFNAPSVTKNPDNSNSITYTLPAGNNGETITHQYLLKSGAYLLDWTIHMKGADKLLTQGAFNLNWQSKPVPHEKDAAYERLQTNICFEEDNGFDYMMQKTEKTFEKPVQWVSVAQQFFNMTLIAKENFTTGEVRWARAADTASSIAEVTANLQKKLPLGAEASVPLQLYFGPNDYTILKQQAEDMDKIVNLGRDMYAFVRPINKYIIMPVFDFFKSFIGSFGLVILLLTLVIRLVTSPLVYTSYLSGAKMKALRPEIEKMKARLGGDQQAVGMEQMKLFREAGVNPLGGCIPALLQIPIFFALYSFFNSNIALRGESFLWSDNLASYDVIARLPFTIPYLGDHISLFTLLAVATSFLISIYNMNMTPDQSNPALKYMPYIFPFIMLFIFNRLPSALTWYYTVSNVITLVLQWFINNYIIDHDKILLKIEENRKKPKVKSKWQERLEQVQEAQKKAQDSKGKPAKR
ncbi:MAG TPA: membrane protein insertase YidC [Flavitalea sp.]|nr:membrane protein insertase YidC [Flavitalea sp.]